VQLGFVVNPLDIELNADKLQRKPLSFHAVSFGQDSTSSLLHRMAQIAQEVQNNAPHGPLVPAATTVLSSYAEALDTVSSISILFLITRI
jgi:hypothetical protein